MRQVIVVDYDSRWPQDFERIRARLQPVLQDIAISIEHVGSTAVPGLPSKPVIDIDVVVLSEDVQLGISRLENLGYCHLGDRGVPQREAFRAPLGSKDHHLYLCPASSPALANHLVIRDRLRSNPSDAYAYGELKKRLAVEFRNDRDGYVEAKTRFLVSLLRQCGFSEHSIREIESMNFRSPRAG